MSEIYAASLTPESVKDFVGYIASIAADDEAAHAEEDHLHREVLAAIATSHLTGPEAALAALACLETDQLNFARWCA